MEQLIEIWEAWKVPIILIPALLIHFGIVIPLIVKKGEKK